MARCWLTAEDGKEINLTHGETSLGRGPFLGINDKKCSREQAKIFVGSGFVTLTPLGVNPMYLFKPDGTQEKLIPGAKIELHPGDAFTLLPNQYRYVFNYQKNEDSDTEEIDEPNLQAMVGDVGAQQIKMDEEDPPRPDRKRKAEAPLDPTGSPKKLKLSGGPVRPRCKYGENCYRTNPVHKQECSHPGDPDWGQDVVPGSPPSTPASPPSQARSIETGGTSPTKHRLKCVYAENCLRKNVAHKQDFAHPGDPDWATALASSSPRASPAPVRNYHSELQQPDFDSIPITKTPKNIAGLAWSMMGTPKTIHVLNSPHVPPSTKIAAFDMDGTLILTKSGNVHPKDRTDWKWWSEKVKKELIRMIGEGYKIVIITNQAGIKKSAAKGNQLEGKIMDMCLDLGYPMQVLMAADKDVNRKPNTRMWDILRTQLNGNVPIDLKKSFYIGDAAGRMGQWKPGKGRDFACTDRKFAHNVGLKFQTPEEFFDGEQPAEFEWDGVDPDEIIRISKILQPFSGPVDSLVPGHQEVILMVGRPASGKSYFSKKYLLPRGYEWVNRDTLKTPEKCVKATKAALTDGKSVVIDNTNPDKATREKYINVAKEFNVPCRCFIMSTKRDVAEHLNAYRAALTGGAMVPSIAYNVWEGKYQEPELKEGFKEIKKVHFVPTFKDEDEKRLFRMRT